MNQLSRRETIVHPACTVGYISQQVRLPQNHKLFAFLPLVFVIGTEGFAMFAPYVIMLLALAHFARWLKAAPTPAPIPV